MRSQWDIMAKILKIARDAETKTHIMYGANLSYRQLKRYLELLMDKELLKVCEEYPDNPHKLFTTTKRGISFLEAYHQLEEIIEK